jgi:hypothetical protein
MIDLRRDCKFIKLTQTEEQERENLKKSVAGTEILRTRQMFFDLKRCKI